MADCNISSSFKINELMHVQLYFTIYKGIFHTQNTLKTHFLYNLADIHNLTDTHDKIYFTFAVKNSCIYLLKNRPELKTQRMRTYYM